MGEGGNAHCLQYNTEDENRKQNLTRELLKILRFHVLPPSNMHLAEMELISSKI